MRERLILRKERFLKLMNSDLYISNSNETIRYLTDASGSGILLIIDKIVYIIANQLSYPAFKSVDKQIADIIESNDFAIELKQIISEKKVQTISYQPEQMDCAIIKKIKENNIKLVEQPYLSEKVRMIKDEYEIKKIKKAAIINRNAIMAIFPYIKPGITEKELACELEYQMRKKGSDGLSFPTIVASKKNAYNPHSVPSDMEIDDDDVVLIDFGATVEGYHADQTYTFIVGKADSRTRQIYNAVFLAQYDAIEAVREGIEASKIDEFARKRLEKEDLVKYFIHGTGHGVGLAIHELPWIGPSSKQIIKPNMVFTIEPGVYLENRLGIRHEVMVLSHKIEGEVLGFAPIVEVV